MTVFFVALVTTILGTAALLPLLHHRAILDVPNERSSHDAPVPRGGGVVVVAAIVLAAAIAGIAGQTVPWPLLVAVIALAGVGFVDDLRSLGGGLRLACQLLAAGAVTAWASQAYPGPNVATGIFVIVAIVVVAGYVNAFNFMDGINGISALNGVVAGGWFAFVGNRQGTDELVVTGLALAGASLGFLPWNAPKARIFLGDVGSYGLGLLIIGMAVAAWADGASWLLCIAPLVPYGADTLWALVKRGLGRRPLMTAHREHVYQRLVDSGWGHLASAALTATLAAMCAATAWLLQGHAILSVAVMTAMTAVYLWSPKLTSLRDEISV